MAVIFVADGGDRHEAVRTGLVELHEQPGARHPGDPPREGRADPVGEVAGDQPVDGLALRRHCPALGRGDLLGDRIEHARRDVTRKTVLAQSAGTDEGAMDDEIGIAADR